MSPRGHLTERPSPTGAIRCGGSNSSSSTSTTSAALRVCIGGENHLCAMTVGTTAERMTAVTRTENCVRSMIPTLSP